MKSFHNIDKSGFHPGQYVGYADGVWRILKTTHGWTASKRDSGQSFTRRTLAEISAGLDVTAAHALESKKS